MTLPLKAQTNFAEVALAFHVAQSFFVVSPGKRPVNNRLDGVQVEGAVQALKHQP